MKLILTAGEIMELGIWEDVCDLKGIHLYALNEGRMDAKEEIEFDEDEMTEIGIRVIV